MSKRGFFLLFFIVTTCFSQKKKESVYLDESYNVITKKQYNKRLNSEIYHSLNYDLDTIKYKKLRLSHFFGKLEGVKKQQLFKLLYLRNGVDTTKTLVFHYNDTLKAKKYFPEKDSVAYFKKGRHKHLICYDTFLEQHKKCVDKWRKKDNISILHYYCVNKGHPDEIGEVLWYKDPSNVIKNVFRDDYKNFKFFALKPNGHFFVYSIRDSKKLDYVKLIANKWEFYEKKFYKTYLKLNKNKR